MNFFKPKFWDRDKVSLLSVLLFPITLLIKILSFLRRLSTKSIRPSIPVICVGNIYLGGTGKTPLCIEIFLILKNLNMNPAFIRKKYDSFQDETDLQKQIGPIYESKKRIKALEEAKQHNADVVVLDDGFQDFSIKKDLSIVCFYEKQWIGNGLTIPSGPLRENLSALKRADCVIINGKKNKDIESKIFNENQNAKIFYTNHIPKNINDFQNKKITAFAGIGNPDNFFDLLKSSKFDIIETIKFPDHHKYSNEELENLLNKIKQNNSILLTTEKDFFRIPEKYKKNIECLKIKVEIENKEQFIDEIKKII
jgi:tetraacyldisaccharide 4'-kinase